MRPPRTHLKLGFFSGGDLAEEYDHAFDKISSWLPDRNSPQVLYIAPNKHDLEFGFYDFKKRISQMLPNAKLEFCMASHLNAKLHATLREYQIIFLGGGNTFDLLHHIRKQQLLEWLSIYAARGGILLGLSAGAILMTPTIDMAATPDFDRDEDHIGMTDLTALDLVAFHFFPHYEHHPSYTTALAEFSQKQNATIIAAVDGAGVFFDCGEITFSGPTWIFQGGRWMRLS